MKIKPNITTRSSRTERRIAATGVFLIRKGIAWHVFNTGYCSVPFGKYEGEQVFNVPVSYLIETLGDMRPSIFSTLIQALFRDQIVLDSLVFMFQAASSNRAMTFLDLLEIDLTEDDLVEIALIQDRQADES